MLTLALLAACGPDPIDLTARLDATEVRAGVVTDPGALFGGVAAEGQPGDLKIYNSRVQFVIQGDRDGDFWMAAPGQLVDADVVRPDGQPGRDVVDEWTGMYGLFRLMRGESVTVVSDGADGRAVIRVEGPEAPFEYVLGATGQPDLIPDLGLRFVTDYALAPDSSLLEVTTTATATRDAVEFAPGDVLLGADAVAELWEPGVGFQAPSGDRYPFLGLVGEHDDVAVAILADTGDLSDGGISFFSGVIQVAAALADPVAVPAGGSVTFHRYYGVGPDLATLTDEWLARQGPTDEVTGAVTAPDGPVAGARVGVYVDDRPYTEAVTAADGTFRAKVPQGAVTRALATGGGTGLFLDLPDGAATWSPYAAEPVARAAVESYAHGAVPVPQAIGRGTATEDDPLVLGQPGTLVVHASDGLPFEARVLYTEGRPSADRRLAIPRPGGYAALAFARDGEVRVTVEPGTYDVLAHRGMRYELDTERVTVAAGKETTVEVSLVPAFTHEGWLLGDPHSHASPSPDGKVTMEGRLLAAAARGVQLHFGTDHDHVADYRPLVEALGVGGVTASIVADEVSPLIEGHINVYPLEPIPGMGNHGAVRWYHDPAPNADVFFGRLRARHGSDVIVQINHPLGPGFGTAAKWRPGAIDDPQHWSTDFDAMELLNGGSLDPIAMYLDLTARGVLPAPTGVSDDHGPTGDSGFTGTWLPLGDDPAAVTPDALRRAVRAGRTIAGRGVFLDLSIPPGSLVVGSATLTVTARSASYAHVDRLVLMRDGVVDQQVDGTEATFELAPDHDAVYVVIAEGDHPMTPVMGDLPRAIASAIRVDVAGDGWTAPLPPLTLRE